jgi:hypothetical protein
VDGWPIGYYDYEYPQHKCQEDRATMAQVFKEKYSVPEDLEILLDVFPQNQFDETFGIWPDNMVAFKGRTLIFRG